MVGRNAEGSVRLGGAAFFGDPPPKAVPVAIQQTNVVVLQPDLG